VFYVDGQNKLCDAYYDSQWHKGDLFGKGWVAAPYSRLAAIRLTNRVGADFICLYYQDTADSGDIKQVSYSHSGWATGPPPINDPPLFGTSLAAVVPEAGIKSTSSTDDVEPVVFFQYDKLGLGSSQDLGDDGRFSPITSLNPPSNGSQIMLAMPSKVMDGLCLLMLALLQSTMEPTSGPSTPPTTTMCKGFGLTAAGKCTSHRP
jgi:Fungal fucose-specific lectin